MTRSLEGIRVLDFSRVLAGPYCGMILADLGADVIKIERDGVGDDLRGWGPPFMADGESTYFLSVNRNKRSIAIDLKSEAGRDVARDLVRSSDVVLENFRLGVMESLGLGYEQLRKINPKARLLLDHRIWHGRPAHGSPRLRYIIQSMGGLMSVTGEPEGLPMRVGVAIVDLVTGLYSVIAILGCAAIAYSAWSWSAGRSIPSRKLPLDDAELDGGLSDGCGQADAARQRSPNTVPYKTFATRDGY